MNKFQVCIKLYFVENSLEDYVYDHPNDKDEIYQSFNETDKFVIEDYLITLDLYDFVYYLSYINSVEKDSVMLLPNNTVSFVVAINKKDVSEKDVFESLLYASLEDGEYEGTGDWIIPTKDGKRVYGFIDYRKEENINVKKI
jgi:hypothetical protein